MQNANVTLKRAKALLNTPAGQQSTVDAALANQLSLQAQVQGAQAQLAQSQINLDYTEIRAPIDGKIGRTAVTEGNVVTPSSGVLATIVSQDPMYVRLPGLGAHRAGPARALCRSRAASAPSSSRSACRTASVYGQTGKLDFVDNTVAGSTDTITLRGVIANPPLAGATTGGVPARELVDGEFVTVMLEDAQPVEALAIPRAAVLSDQQRRLCLCRRRRTTRPQQRRIKLGQSTPTDAAVVPSGLTDGENVIVDGIQRVRPGQTVSPAPAARRSGAGPRADGPAPWRVAAAEPRAPR